MVEVLWYINVFTWLSCWEPGFDPRYRQELFIHIAALDPGVFMGTQYDAKDILSNYVFAHDVMIGSSERMLPWEWKLCTVSAVLKLYPTTGVIILCSALNIRAGWKCAHYKFMQLLLSLSSFKVDLPVC